MRTLCWRDPPCVGWGRAATRGGGVTLVVGLVAPTRALGAAMVVEGRVGARVVVSKRGTDQLGFWVWDAATVRAPPLAIAGLSARTLVAQASASLPGRGEFHIHSPLS
jgi:hypothetical protein